MQPGYIPTWSSSELFVTPSCCALRGHFTRWKSNHLECLNASLLFPSPVPSRHSPSSASPNPPHPSLSTPSVVSSPLPLSRLYLLLPSLALLLLLFAPLTSSSQIALCHSNTQRGLHATGDTWIACNHSYPPLLSFISSFTVSSPPLFSFFSVFLAFLRFLTPGLWHVSRFQLSSPPHVPPQRPPPSYALTPFWGSSLDPTPLSTSSLTNSSHFSHSTLFLSLLPLTECMCCSCTTDICFFFYIAAPSVGKLL